MFSDGGVPAHVLGTCAVTRWRIMCLEEKCVNIVDMHPLQVLELAKVVGGGTSMLWLLVLVIGPAAPSVWALEVVCVSYIAVLFFKIALTFRYVAYVCGYHVCFKSTLAHPLGWLWCA